MICAFIDEMRAEGYAVEPILRVLRQQGMQIAARTYRAWKRPVRIAARTVTDALVEVYEARTLLTRADVADAGGLPPCAPWGRW